jgi:hypothetical protein
VDTGFRPQRQRVLHFLETRGQTGLFQMPINENEQLILFFGQHAGAPLSRFGTNGKLSAFYIGSAESVKFSVNY